MGFHCCGKTLHAHIWFISLYTPTSFSSPLIIKKEVLNGGGDGNAARNMSCPLDSFLEAKLARIPIHAVLIVAWCSYIPHLVGLHDFTVTTRQVHRIITQR